MSRETNVEEFGFIGLASLLGQHFFLLPKFLFFAISWGSIGGGKQRPNALDTHKTERKNIGGGNRYQCRTLEVEAFLFGQEPKRPPSDSDIATTKRALAYNNIFARPRPNPYKAFFLVWDRGDGWAGEERRKGLIPGWCAAQSRPPFAIPLE